MESFHSIPRDATDKEQASHVGVPNNRRLLVFYCLRGHQHGGCDVT